MQTGFFSSLNIVLGKSSLRVTVLYDNERMDWSDREEEKRIREEAVIIQI